MQAPVPGQGASNCPSAADHAGVEQARAMRGAAAARAAAPAPFYADLHVHSRFSRATSRDTTPIHLGLWARKKGLAVVGTGDCTHPAWRRELRAALVPAEPGLFRLRPGAERALEARLPAACRAVAPARFVLQGEIATIYARDGRTRRVHHVVLLPDFAAAERLAARLARVGNLAADGRPILGLDSRDLLEAVLESGDGACLIPAHIWTPWFSVLGAQSGFDSVEDCYRDLAGHIFALETGLSSDPAMNRRVSALDRYTLVSNSDAHSPARLGRECGVFRTDLAFAALRRALATGAGWGGTVEFFPEEGKYYFDGHRACGVRLAPGATRRLSGLCPACGKPVTTGVLHRVASLADRPAAAPAGAAPPCRYAVPLAEILADVLGAGAGSARVGAAYEALLAAVGPELAILLDAPLDAIRRAGPPRLDAAIGRMRAGRARREPGYDGAYGVIRLLPPVRRPTAGRAPRRPPSPPAWSAAAVGAPRPRSPAG